MIALSYVCTLEYPQDKPETVRGELHVPNARLGARRAVETAFKAYPNRRWSSLVVLLQKPADPA